MIDGTEPSQAATNETLPTDRIPVPIYNPSDQITVILPTGEDTYGDKDLYTISAARNQEQWEIRKATGAPRGLPSKGLLWAIDHTSPDVGEKFDAHGIAKGDPVELLNNILVKGIDKDRTLYSTGFTRSNEAAGAIGASYPKAEGGIIIVGDFDGRLTETGVKHVIVGEEYMKVVDLLRKKYPAVQIVPWHDAPKVLTEEYNAKTGENHPYTELHNDNRPYYQPKMIWPRPPQIPPEEKLAQWAEPSKDVGDVW